MADYAPPATRTSSFLVDYSNRLGGYEHASGALSHRAFKVAKDQSGRVRVVSNPPYIPDAHAATMDAEVLEWEARAALFGGEDGLDVVRAIVRALPALLARGRCGCWLEVDPSHPPLLEAWLADGRHGVRFVASHRDLSGRERFVHLDVT